LRLLDEPLANLDMPSTAEIVAAAPVFGDA